MFTLSDYCVHDPTLAHLAPVLKELKLDAEVVAKSGDSFLKYHYLTIPQQRHKLRDLASALYAMNRNSGLTEFEKCVFFVFQGHAWKLAGLGHSIAEICGDNPEVQFLQADADVIVKERVHEHIKTTIMSWVVAKVGDKKEDQLVEVELERIARNYFDLGRLFRYFDVCPSTVLSRFCLHLAKDSRLWQVLFRVIKSEPFQSVWLTQDNMNDPTTVTLFMQREASITFLEQLRSHSYFDNLGSFPTDEVMEAKSVDDWVRAFEQHDGGIAGAGDVIRPLYDESLGLLESHIKVFLFIEDLKRRVGPKLEVATQLEDVTQNLALVPVVANMLPTLQDGSRPLLMLLEDEYNLASDNVNRAMLRELHWATQLLRGRPPSPLDAEGVRRADSAQLSDSSPLVASPQQQVQHTPVRASWVPPPPPSLLRAERPATFVAASSPRGEQATSPVAAPTPTNVALADSGSGQPVTEAATVLSFSRPRPELLIDIPTSPDVYDRKEYDKLYNVLAQLANGAYESKEELRVNFEAAITDVPYNKRTKVFAATPALMKLIQRLQRELEASAL